MDITHIANDALIRAVLVTRRLPPHGTAQRLALDVADLRLRHIDGIVRDHGARGRVVAVGRASLFVVVLRGTRARQSLFERADVSAIPSEVATIA